MSIIRNYSCSFKMSAPLVKLTCSRGSLFLGQITNIIGGLSAQSVRCASKKSSGSTKNKRKNTPGKFRGPKKADGDYVEAGMIMCKQLGLRYYPGENVGCGKDLTLFALEAGRVVTSVEILKPYPISPLYPAVKAGRVVKKTFFHVIPEPQQQIFKLVSQT